MPGHEPIALGRLPRDDDPTTPDRDDPTMQSTKLARGTLRRIDDLKTALRALKPGDIEAIGEWEWWREGRDPIVRVALGLLEERIDVLRAAREVTPAALPDLPAETETRRLPVRRKVRR